jgi:diguanylate cyclase (GGDEF)-like protein
MNSSVVNTKNLVAKRLRQDIVSQKETRLLERLRQSGSLRDKKIASLDFLADHMHVSVEKTGLSDHHVYLSQLCMRMQKLFAFSACGVMWVNANSMLELYEVSPSESEERIQTELDRLGQTGAIVRVLQSNKPALKESSRYGEWLVYHAIRTDDNVIGFMVGVLPEQGMIDGVLLKVFELILRNAAYELTQFTPQQGSASTSNHLHVIAQNDIEVCASRLKFVPDLDRLTGLANRQNFVHHLDVLIAQENAPKLAVVSIDFNQFKRVNQDYGYEAGDNLLSQAAERFMGIALDEERLEQLHSSRSAIHLARVGEDEFAFVLELSDDLEQTALITFALDVVSELSRAYYLQDEEVTIACSAGMSQFPADSTQSGELLIHAMHARLEASKKGQNKIVVYQSDNIESSVLSSLLREKELSIGLKNEQLKVWYQPTFDLSSGDIVGAEALVRWQHPSLGLLKPADFVSLAEASGLIAELGECVLNDACQLILQADKAGHESFTVSLNLSPVQLLQQGLVEKFSNIISEHKVSAHRFELELTDNGVIDKIDQVAEVLHQLSAIGFKISLDDFGMNDASLAMLRRLPVESLKIDPAFIQGLSQRAVEDVAIVNALVALGKSLDIKVLAEGVESEEQFDAVKNMGCDQVQGYYLAKPSGLKGFNELMVQWGGESQLTAEV